MNLGDLEISEKEIGCWGYGPEEAARLKNRIDSALRERLEKAQEVFGTTRGVVSGVWAPGGIKWSHDHWVNLHRDGERCDTHRGRLMCIEEIKK